MLMKFVLILLFFIVASVYVEAGYVMQCNRVCGQTMYERDGCCRSYGFRSMAGGRCSGGWMAVCSN